jgi:hypothetical protein
MDLSARGLRVPRRIVIAGRARRLRRRMLAAGLQALAIFATIVIIGSRRR